MWRLWFIYILENKSALYAALKKGFCIILFFYFTFDETDKKYELIFFKWGILIKNKKKLLASNTNKEAT